MTYQKQQQTKLKNNLKWGGNGGVNNKGSKERLEPPPIISTTFRRFVMMKNYLNTYKTYIPCGDSESLLGRAVATPCFIKTEVSPTFIPRIDSSSIRYLITSIYNKTDNHLSVMLPKYQALLSSLCFVPMIQTPFGKNLNVKPQKYISAKRFNKLNYKTMNNKCK